MIWAVPAAIVSSCMKNVYYWGKQSLKIQRSTAPPDPQRTLEEIVLTAENGTKRTLR
jgi:hypothetical protein